VFSTDFFFTYLTSDSVYFNGNANGKPSNWSWDFGDGKNGTGQTPTHRYDIVGTFNVCMIAMHPCGADTVCKNVTILHIDTFGSIDETENLQNLKIWPNPAYNSIWLEIPDKAHPTSSFVIYDLLGKQVLKKEAISYLPAELSISFLQPGIYFIEVISRNGVIGRARFIKQNL